MENTIQVTHSDFCDGEIVNPTEDQNNTCSEITL